MSRSSLLVLLCVVTLSHVEPGRSQCDGKKWSIHMYTDSEVEIYSDCVQL